MKTVLKAVSYRVALINFPFQRTWPSRETAPVWEALKQDFSEFTAPQIKEFEKTWKHQLVTPNGWQEMKGLELFLAFPKDELHQWLIGLFGDHILHAIVYKIDQVLRNDDLKRIARNKNIVPFFSEQQITAVFKRLTQRLESIRAERSLVTITNKFAGSFYQLYINKNQKVRLTGDRIRMLQLTLPFLMRDLLKPEVFSFLY